MTYEPNVDAAVHFVEHVFPRIRAAHPEVELRIVGRCDDAVARLGSQTNVTVTGYVPRIEDELARSDVVIVPIRFGSGTRIKLLEAFAHRIPAVSTTLGAEGLAVVDGTHLLLADDDDRFATRASGSCGDLELRRALVDEAERLYPRAVSVESDPRDAWRTSFTWSRVTRRSPGRRRVPTVDSTRRRRSTTRVAPPRADPAVPRT